MSKPATLIMEGEPEFRPQLVSNDASLQAPATTIYGEFYGLAEAPFELTPNPRFLFLTERQREAFSSLQYGLARTKGFTLVIGEAGTGKTTLLRSVLETIGAEHSRHVLISNPALTRDEFRELVAREFGLSDEARRSKPAFLLELQQDVTRRFVRGGVTGLIIDEAQSMSHELLEEVRLLGNIETSTSKLLSIVLSGQPELAERLNAPSLRQLKQRIALRCELRPFEFPESMAYIAGRIRIAGGSPVEIFSLEAVRAINEAARGIPRTINVLCENALITGFAAQKKPISSDIIADVCNDFDIGDARADRSEPEVHHRPATPAAAAAPNESPSKPENPRQGPERPMFTAISRPRGFKFFVTIPFVLGLLTADISGQERRPDARQPAPPAVVTAPAPVPSSYVIGAEDVLGIVFWREPELSGDVTVRPDGRITLPVVGEMVAAGLGPETLRDRIQESAAKYLTSPNVAVVVRTINSRRVFVTGRVNTPGPHPLKGPLTAMQAIALAGGLTEYADAKNITILRTENGQTKSFKLNYKDVARGKNLDHNIELKPGDTVVVP